MLSATFLRDFRKLMASTPSDRLPRPRRRLATDAAGIDDQVRAILRRLLGKLSDETAKRVIAELEAEGETADDADITTAGTRTEPPTDPALTHDTERAEHVDRVGIRAALGMDFSRAKVAAFESRFPDSMKIRLG